MWIRDGIWTGGHGPSSNSVISVSFPSWPSFLRLHTHLDPGFLKGRLLHWTGSVNICHPCYMVRNSGVVYPFFKKLNTLPEMVKAQSLRSWRCHPLTLLKITIVAMFDAEISHWWTHFGRQIESMSSTPHRRRSPSRRASATAAAMWNLWISVPTQIIRDSCRRRMLHTVAMMVRVTGGSWTSLPSLLPHHL